MLGVSTSENNYDVLVLPLFEGIFKFDSLAFALGRFFSNYKSDHVLDISGILFNLYF